MLNYCTRILIASYDIPVPKDQVSQASITDEEKAAVVLAIRRQSNDTGKSLLSILMRVLDCNNEVDDQYAVLSICLYYAITQNSGQSPSKL